MEFDGAVLWSYRFRKNDMWIIWVFGEHKMGQAWRQRARLRMEFEAIWALQ